MNGSDGLTGPQIDALIGALMDAYSEGDKGLEYMLEVRLEKSYAQIVRGDGNYRYRVFELVRAARSQGWLPDLITAAVEDRPGNSRLRAWVQSDGQVFRTAITTAAPISLPPYKLVKSMNFDLTELHKKIIRAVNAPVSSVLGFATRYLDDVFVAKLGDWLESYVANTKRKEPLNLWPEIGPVSERLRALARYKGDLASANVVCTVLTQGVPEKIVTEFWCGVHREFAGINRLLLLVFASDAAATLPEGMIELPLPRFEEEDIDLWTLEVVRQRGWPIELASAWTKLLCDEAKYNGELDIRCLYQAMDRTIEEMQYEERDFLMRLRGRIGYADAP